jgi:hypothetical protein
MAGGRIVLRIYSFAYTSFLFFLVGSKPNNILEQVGLSCYLLNKVLLFVLHFSYDLILVGDNIFPIGLYPLTNSEKVNQNVSMVVV